MSNCSGDDLKGSYFSKVDIAVINITESKSIYNVKGLSKKVEKELYLHLFEKPTKN